MVIEREIVAGYEVDSGVGLFLPVLSAEFFTGCLELCEWNAAFPVEFGRFFQFAVLADSRVAKIVCLYVVHVIGYDEGISYYSHNALFLGSSFEMLMMKMAAS